MDVGKRITFFRTIKNYSVNKLAKASGVSQSYLREMELGIKNPSVAIIELLCEALGISLADFFDDGTQQKLENDPLVVKIFSMSKNQREALLAFIETIEK